MSRPARRQEPLDRAAVVRAGVALADSAGLPAVSMRAVAREVGVEAMSLYHHVANKDDLLDGMVDAVIAEYHHPRPGEPWVAELRHRSVSAREALKRHPWAVGLMDSRRGAGLPTLVHHDAVLGCLREAGFSLELAGHAFAVLDAHLYGFLVQELSLPFEGGQDLQDLGAEMLGALPQGVLPYFTEFVVGRALQPGYAFGDEFAVGLDLILEGLERRLDGEPTGRPG